MQLQSCMSTEVKKTNLSQVEFNISTFQLGRRFVWEEGGCTQVEEWEKANTHVFNIKPCVFTAKFRTPYCQTARRA